MWEKRSHGGDNKRSHIPPGQGYFSFKYRRGRRLQDGGENVGSWYVLPDRRPYQPCTRNTGRLSPLQDFTDAVWRTASAPPAWSLYSTCLIQKRRKRGEGHSAHQGCKEKHPGLLEREVSRSRHRWPAWLSWIHHSEWKGGEHPNKSSRGNKINPGWKEVATDMSAAGSVSSRGEKKVLVWLFKEVQEEWRRVQCQRRTDSRW